MGRPAAKQATAYSLAELARIAGARLIGDGGRRILGVASLASAGPEQLSFMANARYRRQLADTGAGAVIIGQTESRHFAGDRLVVDDPHAAFARVAALFEHRPARPPGIHPSAVVDPEAEVADSAHVGPLCSIGARSRIGAGAMIGPGCMIGEDCEIGPGCELVARVTLVCRVVLGKRVLIHPGAVLGADGFGMAMADGRWLKVPQLGGVRIGEDCEIGANTTIDRGALDDTELAEDVRLDNQVQIGHNVRIGAHSALAGCVGVAGSTRIGRNCLIGGAVGIVGHLDICDGVTVTGLSMVSSSIARPGVYGSGIPAQEQHIWRRNLARLHRLDEFTRRVIAQNKSRPDND